MHPIIFNEIFNLEHQVSRTALELIQEELDELHLDLSNIVDYDHSIVMRFVRNIPPAAYGEIRIDRINQNFIACGYCAGYMLPVTGDWQCVKAYLHQLINT